MSISDNFIKDFKKSDIDSKIKLIKEVLYGKSNSKETIDKCIYTDLEYKDKLILIIWISSDADIQEYIFWDEKQELLELNERKIDINKEEFIKVYKYFKDNEDERINYKDISERADMIMENNKRKDTQAYYTPKVCVSDIHKYMNSIIGKDWRENHIVWDSACGTGNLTKDYKFNNLYLSTLEQEDVDIIKILKYNENASVFKYDFLDDKEILEQVEKWNVPNSLISSIKKQEDIIFLINPPYSNGHKHLYIEFIEKIIQIKRKYYSKGSFYMCIISPTGYISDYDKKSETLRSKLLNEFEHKGGILFNSNIFYKTGEFPLAFTIWKAKYNNSISRFRYRLKDYKIDKNYYDDVELYNTDYNISFKGWIKPKKIELETSIMPVLKNSDLVIQEGVRCSEDCLGYYVNNSNNIEQSEKWVFIMNGMYIGKKGFFITKDNVRKVLSNFSTRKILSSSNNTDRWKIKKNQLLKPNTTHNIYKEWENDCIIYSIFNKYFFQNSLRNIHITSIKKDEVNKKIDMYNHFFFMSKEDMYRLSKRYNNNEIEEDIKLNGREERYIYEYILKSVELSEEAKEVLDKAKNIVYETFEYRKDSKVDGINTWDAGWNQIMIMIEKCSYINYEIKDKVNEFNELYKRLENKLELLINELDILI